MRKVIKFNSHSFEHGIRLGDFGVVNRTKLSPHNDKPELALRNNKPEA